jgi:hypothetical protein
MPGWSINGKPISAPDSAMIFCASSTEGDHGSHKE